MGSTTTFKFVIESSRLFVFFVFRWFRSLLPIVFPASTTQKRCQTAQRNTFRIQDQYSVDLFELSTCKTFKQIDYYIQCSVRTFLLYRLHQQASTLHFVGRSVLPSYFNHPCTSSSDHVDLVILIPSSFLLDRGIHHPINSNCIQNYKVTSR